MTDVPIGPIVADVLPTTPRLDRHIGASVTLEPLTTRHAPDLWDAAQAADMSWTYLKYGPFPSATSLTAHIERISGVAEQPFFAIIPASSGRAEGWASFCDIAADQAALEIGSIWFSPALQRTRPATEAIFLMMQHAFALGYHRIAWRCNALNAPSMRAARRFGFIYEGTWRGDGIVKGRRRDTAWFSLLAPEWAAQRQRFETWLNAGNFDTTEAALTRLSLIV